MESFRIKNLRSIKDSNDIEINRCNFFIGANGTGKSSILRFFPLIKQTISQKSSSPILWYAKEGVDFGSYDESVNKSNKSRGITLLFEFNTEIEISKSLISRLLRNYAYWGFHDNESRYHYWLNKDTKIDFQKVEITILDNKFSSLTLFFDSQKIKFDFSEERICVDKEEYENVKLFSLKGEYPLLPSLAIEDNGKKVSVEEYYLKKLKIFLQKDTNLNISAETWLKVFERVNYSKDRGEIYSRITTSKLPKTITRKFREANNSINRDLLYRYIFIILSSVLITDINQLISDYFKNIIYIAPIRATAERYYRIQGLSVEEVDPMGANVPMILSYMESDTNLRKEWQDWTMGHFDTKYRARTQGGNTSIVVFIDKEFYNLADTGFGYSQFLPILLMLWQEERRKEESNQDWIFSFEEPEEKKLPKVIIIEQPELHLHPKLQAQFAELLFNIITRTNNKFDFIIETHSTTIINKIGQLIEQSHFQDVKSNPEEKFNLYLVNNNSSKEKIVKTRYDKEGVVETWPIGFL